MKKKLVSLVFGLFMAMFSVFSLTSCSIVTENTQLKNSKVAVKVDDVNLTRNDIINSFYTYYQTNSTYFSYYDNETIEESFYTWAIMKELIKQKSADALYDPQTNPDGYIVFTVENEKNVWKSAYNYIYSQVSTYEKNVYKSAGYEEANYPVWLTDKKADETASSFESYVSKMPEGVSTDKSEYVDKLTDAEVLAYAANPSSNLKKYLFEYAVEVDEDGNETRKAIKDIIAEENAYNTEIEKDKYIANARSQAYVDYIAGLVNTAKSSGKAIDEQKLIEDEILRVYDAYYESEISSLLQKYYLDEYLISGEETPLTEKAIAEKFIKEYYSDFQTYSVEDAYITTMTSTDGASLVLYHYNGQNYFFTVQHILMSNDEHISKKIKDLPGYDSTGKFDYDATSEDSVAKQFFKDRQELTDNYFMTAKVNESNIKDSINIADYAHYYYYDETRADNATDGYIRVVKVETGEGDDKVIKYYEDANADGNADLIDADEDGDADDKIEIDASKVSYLSTKAEVLDCYSDNYDAWVALADEYIGYFNAKDATNTKKMRDENKDLIYVFDTLENMTTAQKPRAEILEKLTSYLFVELEWVFSGDSLGNKLSNKMGYVMSNYPDEHGSWVSEFADGARELIKNIETMSGTSVQEGIEKVLKGEVAGKGVVDLTNTIVSTYGYHIIKVENIYACGSSMVDVEAIKEALNIEKIDLSTDAQVAAVIKALKETYVCKASNQTLYDYYFDELYTGFVGSSWLGDTSDQATSGTYFLKLEYEWLYELYKAEKIEYVDKISYEELLESIK